MSIKNISELIYQLINLLKINIIELGPSDQIVGRLVCLTIETNGVSLTEWIILVRRIIQITRDKEDSRAICFQWLKISFISFIFRYQLAIVIKGNNA